MDTARLIPGPQRIFLPVSTPLCERLNSPPPIAHGLHTHTHVYSQVFNHLLSDSHSVNWLVRPDDIEWRTTVPYTLYGSWLVVLDNNLPPLKRSSAHLAKAVFPGDEDRWCPSDIFSFCCQAKLARDVLIMKFWLIPIAWCWYANK